MRRFGDLSSSPRDYYSGYPSLQQNEAPSTAPSIADLLSMSQSASSDRSAGTDLELQRLLSHYQQQQGNQNHQVQHQQPDITSLLLLQLQQQYASQAPQAPSSSDYDAFLKQHEEQSMLSRIMTQQRSTSDYEAAALQVRQEDHQLLVSRVMAQQRQLDEAGKDLNESTLAQQQCNKMSQLHQYPPAFGNARNTSDSMIQGQLPPSFLGGGQEEIPGRGQLLPRTDAVTTSALNIKVPGYLEAKVGEEVDASLNKSTVKTEAEDATEDASEEEEEEAEDTGREEDPNNDTFPHKLYRMVAEAEEEGNDNIVSFFAHGKAFAIHKPHDFVREIMPKYFTTSRMSSFQRQLNLYGFRRITEGQDKGGYFHDSFLKGRKKLIKKIKRKKTSVRAPPNFFAQALASGGQAMNSLATTGRYNLQDSLLGASVASSGVGVGGDVNQALLLLMRQQQAQQQQQTDLMQQLLFLQQQGQGHDLRFG
jgi:hypothetical protein